MRDRLLIRHFLWRFLEHDLISPNADRHVVLSVIAGTLVAVSLFLVVLIAAPYQLFPLMPPGIVSLRSLDRAVFLYVRVNAGVGTRGRRSMGRPDARLAGHLGSRRAADPASHDRPYEVHCGCVAG